MSKKKVFVSFDYENDRAYYYLMKAWDANPNFDFVFSDYSSREIQSDSVSVVKACLTKKIKEATYTLCIVGAEADVLHPDWREIGYRNWQNFEVARSIQNGNKLIGVKIRSTYAAPEELRYVGAKWAYSFSRAEIVAALDRA